MLLGLGTLVAANDFVGDEALDGALLAWHQPRCWRSVLLHAHCSVLLAR